MKCTVCEDNLPTKPVAPKNIVPLKDRLSWSPEEAAAMTHWSDFDQDGYLLRLSGRQEAW
jgi:hypothetical protein